MIKRYSSEVISQSSETELEMDKRFMQVMPHYWLCIFFLCCHLSIKRHLIMHCFKTECCPVKKHVADLKQTNYIQCMVSTLVATWNTKATKGACLMRVSCQSCLYQSIILSNNTLQLHSGMDKWWEWQVMHAWLTCSVPSKPTHPY